MQAPNRSFEGFFSSKGSRFIAKGERTHTPQEAKAFLQGLKEHPDYRQAVHFCFAWRILDSGIQERTGDDGEPAGTAGLPILRQLQSFEVIQTTLVVIRFFGGVLLGRSGLTESYRESAKNALEHADLVPFEETISLRVSAPFAKQRLLEAIIRTHEGAITNRTFNHGIVYELTIKKRLEALLLLAIEKEREIQVLS